MNQQLSASIDHSTPIDSNDAALRPTFEQLKRNNGFVRLREIVVATKIHGGVVRLWAERAGLVIWHNKRAGTLVGTAKARTDDNKFMKAIYG